LRGEAGGEAGGEADGEAGAGGGMEEEERVSMAPKVVKKSSLFAVRHRQAEVSVRHRQRGYTCSAACQARSI